MRTALLFAILGLVGLVGCFFGAMHHAMTAVVCLMLSWVYAEDWLKERNEQQQ